MALRENSSADLLRVTEAWRQRFAGAHAGVLALRMVANPASHEMLQGRKAALEAELRARFGGMDRAALRKQQPLAAYDAYYRRFDKTYHVQLQLESIVFKGKSIPSAAALVEAMFMAELQGLLLTAGHDLDAISGGLTLDVATGQESYTLMRGEPQQPRAGDMMISDRLGIISSIVYGPDQRTQIRPETTRAVFTIYAPAGVTRGEIQSQLDQIVTNVRLFTPAAEVELLQVLPED